MWMVYQVTEAVIQKESSQGAKGTFRYGSPEAWEQGRRTTQQDGGPLRRERQVRAVHASALRPGDGEGLDLGLELCPHIGKWALFKSWVKNTDIL